MLVIPANMLVDFHEVRLALGLTHVRLATELELGQLFPDCELGAMPPFGSLYRMPDMDSYLADQDHIAFNAGTHRDAIHMSMDDYHTLVNPLVASFAVKEASIPAR